MDKKTVDKLNQLNKEFYLKTQEYFNRTRQYYWKGWGKLLPYLPRRQADLQGQALKVLDVGCGNGRFGKFLIENDFDIKYVGIDSNQYLLDEAKKAVLDGSFINQDLLDDWQIKGKFDLIAISGVLHHFKPEKAAKILKKAVKKIKGKGVLFLSFWQFDKAKDAKKLKDLENNDYIVDWQKGVKAERYCHLYKDEEINKLLKNVKLKKLKDYQDDGSNKYIILKQVN
ncbi:class I SAM-dependent methyltransferase [Patescibacteria group bacterium]